MKTIIKVNLFENKTEEISMFDSPLTRKFDAMGVDAKDAIIKICAECPKKDEEEAVIKASLTNMVATGFMLNGINYRSFMSGSSDGRNATSSWVNEDILPELGRWAMCGLQTKNMTLAINKYMAYIGLLSSASKPFADVFGSKIDIRRVAIIKDGEVNVAANVDFVDMESIKHNIERTNVINAFDGFGIVRKELTNGESCTIRGPWLKAFCQATNWSKLFGFASANGKKSFVDFFGVERQLKDVDMILTESCFKTAKLYTSWKQYCDAFEELGHEICACVREHAPRLKGMPYQQGQTLSGTEDDALRFMQHAKKSVYKYHDQKEAACLLRGSHRQAAKMYPAMLNESYTKKAIQEMYTTKRNDMLGGRIPELGYNAFLAPDPFAFAQHLFGLPVTGYLKAGECFCSAAKEGFVDVTRNPHLDNAHCVLNNVASCPLAEGPTMFINIFDMTTIQLRADYDGDHVWYSQDEHLLELVNRTYESLKNIPIDWEAPKAPKVPITKSAIAGFITNLIHGSEIGLYADALTKMWNTAYDRDVCDWLTYAGNVLIDAAKHGSIKIKKPDAVKELNMVSLPLFAMYAKATVEHPAGNAYWLKERVTKTGITLPPRCAYSGSFLDMYSKAIQENIPEILNVDGTDDMIFDSSVMMIDAHRKIGRLSGLAKKGIYDPESNTFKECGVFQEIAFRHSTEWNKLVGDTSFFANRQEWEEEVGRAARKELVNWARAQYADYPQVTDEQLDDACYDIILRNIFNTRMSEGMDTVIKQAFWRIYGDKAVATLKTNLNSSIPDFEGEDWDELFDDCD